MFNSPFPRKLILLKKLLYHIGKHKLDIHGRILSIIAVFFLQTLIMLSELPDIFPADVFRDQLQNKYAFPDDKTFLPSAAPADS